MVNTTKLPHWYTTWVIICIVWYCGQNTTKYINKYIHDIYMKKNNNRQKIREVLVFFASEDVFKLVVVVAFMLLSFGV